MTDFLHPYLNTLPTRKLTPRGDDKPLDVTGGGVMASINRDGRVVAVSGYHQMQGIVMLTSVPPFDESQRYNPDAVRAYRKSIAASDGFGYAFDDAIVSRETWLIADTVPLIRLTLAGGAVAECLSFVTTDGVFVQRWWCSVDAINGRVSGRLWLTRAAYTQLTEGGVLPMPSSVTQLQTRLGRFALYDVFNPDIRAWAGMLGYFPMTAHDDGSIGTSDSPLQYTSHMIDNIWMGETVGEERGNDRDLRDVVENALELTGTTDAADDAYTLAYRRGLTYARGCGVPTERGATCVLTDHMLLPLSWNRDSYYTVMPLISRPGGHDLVRRHLVWLFEQTERIDGLVWGRSYLANGRMKDRGYQLDQQIYPLLELAEYTQITRDNTLLNTYRQLVRDILARLDKTRHPDATLFPTDETPGDDPIAYPYHLSSHILLCYMLRMMFIVDDSYGFEPFADGVQRSVNTHFITEYNGQRLYAYATDGAGRHHLYHDANDIPTALAPVWMFGESDDLMERVNGDAVWRATMDFAFSSANVGGYYDGRLGSVHTRSAWPLGDVQDLIVARILGDHARAARARDQIGKAAQWDGALPEAYDPATFAVVSRHWFAWPNAMLPYVDWALGEGKPTTD